MCQDVQAAGRGNSLANTYHNGHYDNGPLVPYLQCRAMCSMQASMAPRVSNSGHVITTTM
jgi:hypothetical protein